MNRMLGGWMDGWVDEYMGGWMGGQMGEWMDEQMDGWMDGDSVLIIKLEESLTIKQQITLVTLWFFLFSALIALLDIVIL